MTQIEPGVWVPEAASPLLLSETEAEELYRYTQHDYINPNTYPALMRLVSRLTTRYAPRA